MGNYNTNEMIEFLKLKWQGVRCPLCHLGNWNISDNIFELRQYNKGSLIIGNAPLVPIIPVTCDNCGNTVLVNALVAKVMEPAEIGSKK